MLSRVRHLLPRLLSSPSFIAPAPPSLPPLPCSTLPPLISVIPKSPLFLLPSSSAHIFALARPASAVGSASPWSWQTRQAAHREAANTAQQASQEQHQQQQQQQGQGQTQQESSQAAHESKVQSEGEQAVSGKGVSDGSGASASASAFASTPFLGLAEKEVEIAALKERVLRAYADMENLRERMARENEAVKQFAIQGFAKALLDVADNLGRASSAASAALGGGGEVSSGTGGGGEVSTGTGSSPGAAAPSSSDLKQHFKNLLEGVQATEWQLLKVLKANGVERVNPMGDPFDPNLHEAMFEVEGEEGQQGSVVHVLKEGYTLHGRVLRAAEVGVARSKQS